MEGKTSEKKERKMRDSGIPWIGEVPEGWEFSKIKYHCTMKSGDNITALDISDNGEYPVYGGNGLRGFYKIYNKNGNHILIGRQGALAGNVHLVNGKFWATDHAVVVTLKNDVFINYFFRMLESMDLNQYAFDTAAQPGLSVSRIMNLNIVLPNLKEQHRIADFLDSECSEIDALIGNLRARMESAKEYKKAAITEAVTKGLNKDAKMKDSGVEWIGKIPESWDVIKIGHAFCLRNERNFLPEDKVQLLSLYTGIGVFPTGSENTKASGNHAQTVNGYKVVHKNDIVVNIILAWMGSIGVSNYDGVVSPAYDVYTPDLLKIVPHYAHYVFRTNGIAGECLKYGRGIMLMRWRTYSSEFKQIKIPFPSLVEQQEIADYLDSKCAEIDVLLQNYENQIATLEEYKKSLIYEYVTGQKEVPTA